MKKLVSIAVACALATTMISCSNEVERGPKKHELTVNVAVKAGVDYKIDDLVSLSVVASNPAKDQQYEETDAVGKLPVVFSEAIEGDYTVTVVGIISDAIKLVGSAQVSLYGDQSITVTLDTRTTTPWSVNKTDTGVVTWEDALASGETHTYTISYTVKYPKDMNLNLF